MSFTRRRLLQSGLAAASVGSLSGCLSLENPVSSGGEQSGYTAFFTIQDWAEHIAGDQFELTNPISVGQMGHGWSPDGNIARDIASTSAFLYLDTPEFSWAQDVAAELDRDYDDVATYDLLDGLGSQLIGFDSGALPDFDHGHDYPRESLRLDEFDIYDLRSTTNSVTGIQSTGTAASPTSRSTRLSRSESSSRTIRTASYRSGTRTVPGRRPNR